MRSSLTSMPGLAALKTQTQCARDGVVFKIPLIIFVFAADHQFTFSAPTPSGLSGLDLGLMSFRFGAFGNVEQSTTGFVHFE